MTSVLTVFNSTFTGNSAVNNGGGIFNDGAFGSAAMAVAGCTFINNSSRDGGGVQHDAFSGSAPGSITNCTFAGNSVSRTGGAINVDGTGGFQANGMATLNVSNCTFYQNSANSGGVIAMDGSDGSGSTGNAIVNVSSCTCSDNSATNGSAMYLSETTSGTTVLHIGNTILKTDVSGPNFVLDNISGGTVTVTSHGYNLNDDAGAGVLTATGDQINVTGSSMMLDPAGLKDNGGPTQTIALQATSPALDHGKSNTISSLNNDQRTEPRPFDDPFVANASGGDGSDIGAYEADVRTISEQRVINDLHFSFTTILGHNYEVQGQTSLNPGGWSTVNNTTPAPPIAGTGGIIEVTIPNAFSPGQGFYRAHQLP